MALRKLLAFWIFSRVLREHSFDLKNLTTYWTGSFSLGEKKSQIPFLHSLIKQVLKLLTFTLRIRNKLSLVLPNAVWAPWLETLSLFVCLLKIDLAQWLGNLDTALHVLTCKLVLVQRLTTKDASPLAPQWSPTWMDMNCKGDGLACGQLSTEISIPSSGYHNGLS